MKLRSVRGTHDLYGDDIKKYNHIKDVVSNKAELQSFNVLDEDYGDFIKEKPANLKDVEIELADYEDRKNKKTGNDNILIADLNSI